MSDEPKRVRCPECLAMAGKNPLTRKSSHNELAFKDGYLAFKKCWLCMGGGLVPEDVCIEHSLIRGFTFNDTFELAEVKKALRQRVEEAEILRFQRMMQPTLARLGVKKPVPSS